jgi:Domain of unknown function (DUF202)
VPPGRPEDRSPDGAALPEDGPPEAAALSEDGSPEAAALPEDRSPGAAALPEDPEDLFPGTAAERTRLAWERTAITFGAVGLAMLRDEPVAGLIVLAVTPVIWALARFVSAAARPEARSRRLLLVTVAVTSVAVVAVVAALLGHGSPVRLR